MTLTGLRVVDGVLYADMSNGTSFQVPLPASGGTTDPVPADPVVGYLWIGHTTDSATTLTAAMITGTDEVRFAAVPVGGGAAILSAPVAVDATYRFARGTITGLAADTQYDISLRSSAGQIATGTGRLRTPPAAGSARSFSFAAASCSTTASDALIYDRIRDRAEAGQIEFFQHMGDIHYRNISTNSPALFNEALDEVFQQPRQAAVWRSLPMYYIYDDHDYSANNGHRLTASRPAAVATFRSRVPSPPLPNTFASSSAQSVYYGYTRGRFRFLVTDMRADRDSQGTAEGPAKTLLGAQQKQWLKDEIVAAKAAGQFVVWVNPVPWNTLSLPGDDSWGGYTTERQELVDFFTTEAMRGRMVIVSGDMHALAWDDGTNSPGGIPVMQAAALDRDSSQKGGPYTIGPLNGGVGWGTFVSQYGVFDITDAGGDTASIRFRGLNVDRTAGTETALIDVTHSLSLVPPVVVEPEEPEEPAPTSAQYFTDFQGFAPGALVAPWSHMPGPINDPLFVFADAGGGDIVLRQPTTATLDTGAYVTAVPEAATSIEVYAEGSTTTNNSSSLEFLPAVHLAGINPLYRVDFNPATGVIRLRERVADGSSPTGVVHTSRATFTSATPMPVGSVVSFLSHWDGSVLRIKIWPRGGTEPAWQIEYTDTSPIPFPVRAGVYNFSQRPGASYHAFGVGIDGAAAPRVPVTTEPADQTQAITIQPTSDGFVAQG